MAYSLLFRTTCGCFTHLRTYRSTSLLIYTTQKTRTFIVKFQGFSANKEETLRLLEGLIKYQQPSKASTWNRQEAQAHAQR